MMKLARSLTYAGALLSAGALAAGYAPDTSITWFVVIGLVGLLWLAAEWRGWARVTSLALVATTTLAAVGVLLGRPAGWNVAAVALGITAWTLGGTVRRLASLPNVADVEGRLRRLMLRLLVLDVLSLGLAAAALQLELQLPFVASLLLGGLLIYGLSRVIDTLRRESV